MELEESTFVWKIVNFPVVLQSDQLISFQWIEVNAGDQLGHPSKWRVYLQASYKDDKKWIGIYYKWTESLATGTINELYSQMKFVIKTLEGRTIWDNETLIRDLPTVKRSWGFPEVFDRDTTEIPEVLKIHINFKLYAPAKQTGQAGFHPGSQLVLDKYQVRFGAKALKDLAVLVRKPIPGEVKIISSDEQEFVIPWGTLSARSPVFEAMLRTNINEANGGVVRLPDMTGKSLEVILHFMCVGELLPEWKESGTIVQITNTAAKYQLSDLLEFLDVMLGKICDLENVAPLFALANQIPLKTAEKELLKFIREKGTSSPENFVQIMKAISGSS